jgi:Flp pilus assembly pilin Flp
VVALFGMEDRAGLSATAGGQPHMSELSVFKTWLMAKLNIKDERGANLVEYVFLLVFIALVVVIAVTALGGKVSSKFSQASSKLGG